jgi:hypothetical protein
MGSVGSPLGRSSMEKKVVPYSTCHSPCLALYQHVASPSPVSPSLLFCRVHHFVHGGVRSVQPATARVRQKRAMVELAQRRRSTPSADPPARRGFQGGSYGTSCRNCRGAGRSGVPGVADARKVSASVIGCGETVDPFSSSMSTWWRIGCPCGIALRSVNSLCSLS